MRRLNVRRGLFRLWLIATVGYEAFVGLVWIGLIRNAAATPAPPPGFVTDSPWPTAIGMIAAMTLPPAVVFGAGLALLWAFAGFAGKADRD